MPQTTISVFPDQPQLKALRGMLAEDRAEALPQQTAHALLNGNAEKGRFWALTRKDYAQAALDALTQYTDLTKNAEPQAYVVDPKIDGEGCPGTWRQVRAMLLEGPDGKPRVGQILKRVYYPLTVDELKQLTVLKVYGNKILHPFGVQPGEDDEESWIYRDLDIRARAKCEGFGDAALVNALAGSDWTFVTKKFEEQENNTAAFTVVFRKVAWPNTVPTYEVMRFRSNGGWERITGYLATGVPIASAEGFVTALKADDHVMAADWTDAGDGEAHVSYVKRDTGLSIDDETRRAASTGRQRESVRHTWYGVEPADIAATWTTAKTYTGEPGDGLTHKWADRVFHTDGWATIVAEAWSPPPNSGYITSWTDQVDNEEHEIVRQDLDWDPNGVWAYLSRRYTIYYNYSEEDAYDDVDGGLDGSHVYRVAGVYGNIWAAKKVTKIVQSSWYAAPVNTGTNAPPAKGTW